MQITNPGPHRTPADISRAWRKTSQHGGITRSIVALLALTILGASATAITYFLTNRDAPGVVEVAAAEPAAPIFIHLDPFTVTLSRQDYERFLHVAMTLKLADERSRTHIQTYMPVVRSRVLMLLGDQNPDSVHTTEGKRELANAIRHTVNMPFDGSEPQQVIDVLFTAFVVQ